MITGNIPAIDIDLFAAESLRDPYRNYSLLRDAAPIVKLVNYDFYVMSRFADVQEALKNAGLFSSASGVGLNDHGNAVLSRSTLASDDPLHAQRRAILFRKLTPGSLNTMRARITEEAENLVDSLVRRQTFDAVTDLSRHLPATIVFELLGVPDVSVDTLLEWTKGGFNSLGPPSSPLTASGIEASRELLTYAMSCTPDRVRPGGWADYLFGEARKGTLDIEQASALIFDYLGPSLDTTITATTNAVKLFGEHPEQWRALRERPASIPNAINEVVRLESPVQAFSRLVTEDTKWGEQFLPRGVRVLLLYGSANRDERRWDQPERFDISRANTDHIGFGHGVHSCAGANLARLEMTALFTAMIARIEEIQIEESEVLLNNFLRGFQKLRVSVRAAQKAPAH